MKAELIQTQVDKNYCIQVFNPTEEARLAISSILNQNSEKISDFKKACPFLQGSNKNLIIIELLVDDFDTVNKAALHFQENTGISFINKC